MLDFLFWTAKGLCRKFAKKQLISPLGWQTCYPLGWPSPITCHWSPGHLWNTALAHFLGVISERSKMCNWSHPQQCSAKSENGYLWYRNASSPTKSSATMQHWWYSARQDCCHLFHMCRVFNKQCLERIQGNPMSYKAIDTDHNGHPLREADNRHLQRCREKLPDCLTIKIGARVILRRNINISSGWVNGTLAVVTSMHSNCIVQI